MEEIQTLDIVLEETQTLNVELENNINPTRSYNELKDKPQINDITLEGNKSLDDLDIQVKGEYANSRITNTELEEIFSDW